MYEKNLLYKFTIYVKYQNNEKPIYYTGHVLEEDNFSIKIKTIREEELILNKSNIFRADILRTDENGK